MFGIRIPRIPPDTFEGKKIIVVVGGAGILGAAFAAAAPKDVCILNLSRKTTLEGEHVLNIPCDVRKDIDSYIKKLAIEVPYIDGLINMQYTKTFSSIEQFDTERFLDEMLVDTASPIVASLACGKYVWSKHLKQDNVARSCKVIQISSRAADGKTARPELATYGAAKSALNALTPYLHEYLYETYGVSAHIVAPGSLREPEILHNTVQELWNLVVSSPKTSQHVRV